MKKANHLAIDLFEGEGAWLALPGLVAQNFL